MEVERGAKKKIRQGKVLKDKELWGGAVLVVTFGPKLQKIEQQGLGDSSETGKPSHSKQECRGSIA